MPKQNKPSHPRLILASASPRRKLLLRKHGYKFSVQPSHVSENLSSRLSPGRFVKTLALRKALLIAKKNPQDVALGADTIVFVKGRVIGKPKGRRDAERILRRLSGVWQQVYTGVVVAWAGGQKTLAGHAVSNVKFRRLTDQQIERASHRHLDKAGAYSVQHKRDRFVEKITGDYDNVVGLPMRLVRRLLGRTAQHFLKTVGYNIHFKV